MELLKSNDFNSAGKAVQLLIIALSVSTSAVAIGLTIHLLMGWFL